MENLEIIGQALADDATAEQRAAGAEACRAILLALGRPATDAAPVNTPAPLAAPRSQVEIGQAVELLIARLGPIAQAKQAAKAASVTVPTPSPAPATVPVERVQRLNIPFVPITPITRRGGRS